VKHTTLTLGNFASFTTVMAGIGFVTVGLGAVDMAMVAPFGEAHLAAVGQGEVLATTLAASMKGLVDVFSSRLAIREGAATTNSEFPALLAALLLLFVPAQVVCVGICYSIRPFLAAVAQDASLIGPISDYVRVRIAILPIVTLFFVFNESLKICGLKNFVLVNLCLGFGLNAVFNFLLLYTPLVAGFPSIECAVALSTVITQSCMALFGGVVFFGLMRRRRGSLFVLPLRAQVWRHFCDMSRAAPGTVARQLNDYAGTVIPLLFIGTLGVSTLAAAQVATKIFTIFCRIPQACLAGVFTFYGYGIGRHSNPDVTTIRRLLCYSAVPTIGAAVLVLAFNKMLVSIFAGPDLDRQLAMLLVLGYLTYLPSYFFEQFFAECLIVHQQGNVLLYSSTVATYGLTIPLADFFVIAWQSSFCALASKGVATLVLAVIFLWHLRQHHWRRMEQSYA
jgi:MATE family multidrug resistance protein